MTHPLVSVVIPCYRQGHLLPAALESVFAQTHPAVEAVVVNDGSDDDTDAVARRHLPRIRYVAQANAGLPAARNAGIAAASGRYLLFLDADDMLHARAVEWLVGATGGRDDVLALCGWRPFVADPLDPADPAGPAIVPDPGGPFPRLIHANIAPPHAYLCSRRLVDEIGGFEVGLRSCEDWDLWVRIAITGAGLAVAPHVGAYYRHTPGSMSSNRPRMLTTRTEVLLRTYAAFAARPELLTAWGADLAEAALRVRRRLLVQHGPAHLVAALTATLDALGRTGSRPFGAGKGGAVARLLGRDRAERLVLAYYRQFDRSAYRALQDNFW